MPDRNHTLYLLDGMALVYRAHFAFATNPIRTSAGRNTSAIYGFANTLLELLAKQQPTHLAVVFDTAAPTARHREFPAYKAQREEMPEDLSAAIPDVKRLIRAFNFPVLELDGYEADDIIGTIAREAGAAAEAYLTYMVTPDKDFGQLVTAKTLIYRPGRMGDGAEILGVPEVLAKWGVTRCDQVRDILGLWGDTSDNIPGVPGIGEKTAQKLITQYDTLENVLDHAAEQKGKLKESLEKFRDQALLSKRLATIDVNVPLPFKPDQLLIGPRNDDALRALFSEFEFNTLGRRLFGDSFKAGRGGANVAAVYDRRSSAASSEVATVTEVGADIPIGGPAPKTSKKAIRHPEPTADRRSEGSVQSSPQYPPIPPVPVALRTIDDLKPDYHIVSDAHEIEKLTHQWSHDKNRNLAIAYDLDPRGTIRGQAFSVEPGRAFYFLAGSHVQFRADFAEGRLLIGHDLKPGLRILITAPANADHTLRWPAIFDTALAHAVVFPDLRHTLPYVAESLLNYTPIPEDAATGQQDFLGVLEESLEGEENAALRRSARRTMERADLALQLHALLVPRLKESGQEKVFYDIESPLLPVLAAMEREGIRLDPTALEDVGKKLRAGLGRLETSIYEHAGTNFNIGSPRQLGEILFGKLALVKDAKKTKTGQYATDEATLLALAALHPIVSQVLEHREASKLLSTYIAALPAAISPIDGRIHTTFYQLATSTGRLNSQDPNLQNIPIRTAQGREIRRAFVPREGDYTLLSADYSQIELRILAALTRDPGLLDALASGEDIHRATAAKVFGLPLSEVTKEQRNQAKMVNYGISYGISAFGLAQRLGIGRAEAKNLIDGYFAQYPGIKAYMTGTVTLGRERGYVETVTGRRRYLPDLRSANATVRAAAERNAINMPIQGSSADLIKIAMVQIAHIARDENWRSKLLLQVHDELVFDLYLPEKDRILEVIQDRMKHALPDLPVPIVVEIGLGANWLEAH
ncbi:MAG: DNA polymerase I [Methylacidiphilales bacterium]|nr:DNA polymerase I [Candidatus Methylacidiphilales bacterium]